MTTVLVTGATGFVGSHALRALLATPGLKVRATHRGMVAAIDGVQRVRVDLTEPRSVDGLCDGVELVLHAASYIGTDAALCHEVNDVGTRRLVDEAIRAGVRRVVYLSTTGVYGDATATGAAPEMLATNPRTPRSRTRLRAEQHVRRAGGVVVRPHLIYGQGDRWVVPGIVTVLRSTGGLPGGGLAPLSVIAAADLGHLLAAAMTTTQCAPGSVFHAVDPTPTTLAALASAISAELSVPLPDRALPYDDLLNQAPAELRRQIRQLAEPHWYDGNPLWHTSGVPDPPPLDVRLRQSADWYQTLLKPGHTPEAMTPVVRRSAGVHRPHP